MMNGHKFHVYRPSRRHFLLDRSRPPGAYPVTPFENEVSIPALNLKGISTFKKCEYVGKEVPVVSQYHSEQDAAGLKEFYCMFPPPADDDLNCKACELKKPLIDHLKNHPEHRGFYPTLALKD